MFRRARGCRIHIPVGRSMPLLSSLPAHLAALTVTYLAEESDLLLAQRITSITAAGTLAELRLGRSISPEAVDLLLRGLPSLRRLKLGVQWSTSRSWRPAPPPGLTSLRLGYPFSSTPGSLDLSGVAELPALRELDVSSSCSLANAAALAQLQQLTRLALGEGQSVDCWQVISQLPSLQQVSVPELIIPPAAAGLQQAGPAAAAPQLPSLTSLRAGWLQVGATHHPLQQPAFSLAQAMPRLQHLRLSQLAPGQHLPSCEALLQGHPQISYLELGLEAELDAHSGQRLAALLQSLPSLTQLGCIGGQDGETSSRISDALLGLAPALPRLRKLALSGEFSRGMSLALQQLAAGACTGLQWLELGFMTGSSLADVLVLFRGGLPQLRGVRLRDTAPSDVLLMDHGRLRSSFWQRRAEQQAPVEEDAELLRRARAIPDSGELVQALADAVAQQQEPLRQPAAAAAAAAASGPPRTRAAAAAARAAEQAQERELQWRVELDLQNLAARLRQGAAGQPLLPEQEAAALLQRVRRQLQANGRLLDRLPSLLCANIRFMFRGCTIEVG